MPGEERTGSSPGNRGISPLRLHFRRFILLLLISEAEAGVVIIPARLCASAR